MINLPMKKKLLIIFVFLFSIPIIVSMLLINLYATRFSRYSSELLNMRNIEYIGKSVDRFFGSVYDFSLYLSTHKDILNFLSLSKEEVYRSNMSVEAQNAVSLLPFSNSNIASIAILGNDDRYIQSGVSLLTLSEEEKESAIQANGAPVWDISSDGIYFMRLLRSPEKLKTPLGYLKIQLNTDVLIQILTSQNDNSLQFSIIGQNHDNRFVYKKNPAFIPPEIPQKVFDNSASSVQYLKEENYFLSFYSLEIISGYIYCFSEDVYSIDLFSTLLNTLIISMIICFIFCLVLSVIFSTAITAPLKKLGKLMKRIENEDFSVQFSPKGNDEIGQLALQFDQMSKKLNVLYNQVYMDKLKLKEMQLLVLQSQINPHFLYNTLDTIYWMSEFNHTKDVSNMISALSRLFRLALSGDENEMVDLKTELEHIGCYLFIQKIRHDDNLDYTIVNKLHTSEISVLKLILQPLVENSIIHGIEQVGCGRIDILIYEQDNNIIYEVSDTAGMADINLIHNILNGNTSKKKDRTNHIGLYNIQTRIRLHYGNDYGISCEKKEGKTVFTVKLPNNKAQGILE